VGPRVTGPAAFSQDRSLLVAPGQVVKTGYVDVWKCRFSCRERMAVGDLATAFQKVQQLGDQSAWPCPNGHWEGEEFVIHDGRHEYLASLMVGRTHLLVAWLE
jgi:hypothetical protein